MHLKYVKANAVDELRREIIKNKSNYESENPWLREFFGDRQYVADSRIEISELPVLKLPEAGDLFELENTILLYEALKVISPSQAADERLWVYLAHETYWKYMRARWPVENANKNPKGYLLEHYFVGDARAAVRHGISRLWWFGHATYDASASDPYHMTRLLLQTTDARQQLTERTFWRNHEVLKGMLRRVAYYRDERAFDFYSPRERFRRLCKTFNLFGGTILLDALGDDEIYELVDDIATSELVDAAPADAPA